MGKHCLFCDNEATTHFNADCGHYDLCAMCREAWNSEYHNSESDFCAQEKKTVGRVFRGQGACLHAALCLMWYSKWFSVTPLPDNEWRIAVKDENKHVLEGL